MEVVWPIVELLQCWMGQACERVSKAHPLHPRMGTQEFKAPQQAFPPQLWAARASDPI